MTDELVPDDVRDFILRHIDSVAQLEALLLLRANPDEDWDAPKTAKRLYTTHQEIALPARIQHCRSDVSTAE
jgi:hypothetical protein